MLQDTIVVIFGEFGRTPKVNKDAAGITGAGLFRSLRGRRRQGRRGDRQDGQIRVGPDDHTHLANGPGRDDLSSDRGRSRSEVRDQLGRPVKLNVGTPIDGISG